MTIRTFARATAVAGIAVICAACAEAEPTPPPPTPVRVAPAGEAAGSGGLRYSTAILPVTTVPVAFKVPGYVAEITTVQDGAGGLRILQEGDRVSRGQTLARLRTGDFTAKVSQARSQEAEAEAAFAQARQAYQRAQALYERRSLTRTDYDAAKAAYETVLAKRDGARALVAEAGNALADSALASPIDGILLKRLIEVGSLVGPGTPGFVVADTTAVKALFGAPDHVVRGLARGQSLSVTTEAYANQRFDGRITSLAPAADPGSLVFDVEVTIGNADGRLKPGMVASLELDTGGKTDAPALALPLSAIVRAPGRPDGYAVFVVEDRAGTPHARLREVSLGDMVPNGIAVTAGLRGGERVIVTGARMVADGEPVEIVQ